jgi:hypothetical protein
VIHDYTHPFHDYQLRDNRLITCMMHVYALVDDDGDKRAQRDIRDNITACLSLLLYTLAAGVIESPALVVRSLWSSGGYEPLHCSAPI